MPDRNINKQKVDEQQNKETPASEGNDERFLSDTQKIIHRHLENKNDVITEEDIKNVRVGMTPPEMDEPTEARFETDDKIDEVEKDYIEGESDEKRLSNKPITPWDII